MAPLRTSPLTDQPIIAKLTRAPGNGAPIGGLKLPWHSREPRPLIRTSRLSNSRST